MFQNYCPVCKKTSEGMENICAFCGHIIVPPGEPSIAEYETEYDNTNTSEEMSSSKRMLVRIISAVLFILICGIAIFAVDFIAELIKNLF